MEHDGKERVSYDDRVIMTPEYHSVTDYLRENRQPTWFKNPQLRNLYAILLPACLFVAATNGFDGSMINGLQAVDSWQSAFNHPQGALLGILTASYPLGAICSTPFAPIIADRYGRRWAVFVGSVIMLCGVALQTASQSFGEFLGGRVVIGFGITIALSSAPILISELAHPNDRVTVTGLYNTTWYLGAIIAAWTTYGTFRIPSSWGWRIPSLLQGLPALIQVIFIFLLPESPRWLLNKGLETEALSVLARCHGNGDISNPLVTVEFHEIKTILNLEREAAKSGVKQLWSTPGNRRRLFIIICVGLFGQWSGNGLVSYYLSKILKSIGIESEKRQTLINGILTIVNYITSLVAAILIPRIGRRKAFLASTISMFITFSVLTTTLAVYNSDKSKAAAHAALGFIFIFYSCFNLAFNPLLYLYPVEILPYRIRAMGMSLLVFANKLALFLNQFVNPIGLQRLGWKYYLVYVGWLLVEIATVYFFFPETKGYSLEEIAVIFDGYKVKERLNSVTSVPIQENETEEKMG